MSMPKIVPKSQAAELRSGSLLVQNYNNVIRGRASASLHAMAGTGTLPGLRPGDLLSREGWVVPGGQADLRRVHRPHRVPELRPAPRRALRRLGWDERAGT